MPHPSNQSSQATDQQIDLRNPSKPKYRYLFIFGLSLLLLGGAAYFIAPRFLTKNEGKQINQIQSTNQGKPNTVAESNPTALIVKTSELVSPSVTEAIQNIRATGSLRARDVVLVKAKSSGTLQNFNWQIGQNIQQGQVVANIDNTDYQNRYQQALQQLNSSLEQQELLQKQYDRQKQLVADGFISVNALDTISTNLAVAKSQYESNRNALEIAKKSQRDQNIISPISGIIANKFTQNGENIMPDMRLLEVINPKSIELEAAISDQDINKIKIGQAARIMYAGVELEGRVIRVAPSAQLNSRLVNVYIDISPAGQNLKVGAFASAEILLGDTMIGTQGKRPSYQIPSNLVQVAQPTTTANTKPSYYVYVVENNKISIKNIILLDKNSSKAIVQGVENDAAGSAEINQSTQLLNMPISLEQVGKVVRVAD